MAALIVEAAKSAREEAQRLRADSNELKLAVRSNARLAETRLTRAWATAAVARAGRAVPMASPWSGLVWLPVDEELNRVLVPVE
jgi:hypothetical protein